MVNKETINELWTQWAIVLSVSLMAYSIVYRYAFERQLSHSHISVISTKAPNEKNKFDKTDTKISSINENQSLDDTENNNNSNAYEQTHNILNSMKYASCCCSMCNAIVCVTGACSFFYVPYWDDLIYGTPYLAFYVSAISLSYFVIDVLCEILISYLYHFKTWRIDGIVHHFLAIAYCLWILIPTPIYAWILTCSGFAMELSTIFLNFSFFSKWYNLDEKYIRNSKLGFVIAWFLVRVPATIYLIVWITQNGKRMLNEYPLDKFICAIWIIAGNAIIQTMWTILIIKKTYTAITKSDDINSGVDSFNLKRRRNSIDITNVTSEA